ncbi:MAG: thiamine pyrophosphate-binding protein [Clostridia bacterium]|nr:thiamine pyrophosphate-binding protein [Clostridia bacterium]
MIFRSTYNKPILLAGNGARTTGAVELIQEFCKKTNIPLLTTMNAVDIASDDLHIGFIGTHGNRIANMIINECDLIISVGARLGLRQVGRYKNTFAPKAHLIRVDIDQYELSRNIKDDEEKIQIDAKKFMELLMHEDVPDFSDWKNQCLKAKDILDNFDKSEGNLAVEKIASMLPKNAIVAIDVGQNQCWSAQSLVLKGMNSRILIGGGYGAMGCGLPYAIGASIAEKSTPIYCISGDGGFQMNIQELETVKREKLPIKMLILNNRVLGKISEIQHNNHRDRYAQTTAESGYTVPDFQKISEAYGIKAATLSNYSELQNYSDWLNDNEPCLLNILLSEDSLLVPKIKWETGKISPALADDIISQVESILSNTI